MRLIFKRLFVLFCILTLICSFTSCSKKTAKMEDSVQTRLTETAAAPKMKAAGFNSANQIDSVAEEAIAQPVTDSADTSKTERKLIKNGSIKLETNSISSAEEEITTWCASFNGYVSSSFTEENYASFAVRVPAEKFDQAMTSIGNLGTVKSRNIYTNDVTEQFYDLQTRLDTRKILRDRLLKYLSDAKDMKDLIQIENELNKTISDIESMEGRMKRLTDQINYSTINVEFSMPYRTTEDGFQWPEFSSEFRYFISNIVDFFVGFVVTILYIVIFGIPILAAIAFFYWILLGKVGLLRKIFKKLSGNKEE